MAKKNPLPEETRSLIKTTASALFRTGGIYATSLGEIAKAAKLSKGTLYYHFPAKEYLVLEIAEAHFSYITELLFAWIDTLNIKSDVREALSCLTSSLLSDKEALRLHFALLSEALREEGQLSGRLNAKQREWAVMLEVGSLRMEQAASSRFREYSAAYLALLDGFGLHMLLNSRLDADVLNSLLTGL